MNETSINSKIKFDTFVEAARRGEYRNAVLNSHNENENEAYIRHEILNSREKSHWHPKHHKQRLSEIVAEARAIQDAPGNNNVKVFAR